MHLDSLLSQNRRQSSSVYVLLDKRSKKIGTHSGRFHCDDVMACFLLKLLPSCKTAEIIRSRDMDVLKTCDILVDVGNEYIPQNLRFDHHQKTFNFTLKSIRSEKDSNEIKLSSVGLVWAHFGELIIQSVLKKELSKESTDMLYDAVYDFLIKEIDAIDNGVSICHSKCPPLYSINTNLSNRIKRINPQNKNPSNEDFNTAFTKALEIAGTEFLDIVTYLDGVWLSAYNAISQAIKNRYTTDESGEIIVLDGGLPWKTHIFKLEKRFNLEGTVKFVVFEDTIDSWRVQCVPKNEDSFENRLSLFEKWRGLRDEELSQVAQIKDCIFVHSSGFIGGNKSKEGALCMARSCIKQLC